MATSGKRSVIGGTIADMAGGIKRRRSEKTATPGQENVSPKSSPNLAPANAPMIVKQTPRKAGGDENPKPSPKMSPASAPMIAKQTPEKNTTVDKTTPEKGQQAAKDQHLQVCGPEFIQTLRGHLLGREVAIICCGEAHERAMNLTRQGGLREATREWMQMTPSEFGGFHPKYACETKKGVSSLEDARAWAKSLLEWERDEVEDDGAVLMYLSAEGSAKGTAYYFSVDHYFKEDRKKLEPAPANAVMYKWFDTDPDARADKDRMIAEKDFRASTHDAAIARRKQARRVEGLELFDDWLLRRYQEKNGNVRVDYVYEGGVEISEVELHVEPGVRKPPPAHECLKAMELDSDGESDVERRNLDDGCGGFAEYLTRRVKEHFSGDHVHGIDPRTLGHPSEKDQQKLMRDLAKPFPTDREEVELRKADAKYPKWYTDEYDITERRKREHLPSWELYFGQTAELLYYSGGVKADYAPFLRTCLPTPQRVLSFFDDLYFGTVQQAVSHLGPMDDSVRSLMRIRSRGHRTAPNKTLCRRPSDLGILPVKVAPLDKYLKARGSNPPRTWVSGLATKVRGEEGGEQFVEALQSWYRKSVMRLLSNPKDGDRTGDYFAAFLREAHPEIYTQIDPWDPSALRQTNYIRSLDLPGFKRGHYIGHIRNPSLAEALKELGESEGKDTVTTTSKRQRVCAKIIVDAFQLRLVDTAAILKVASIAASAPVGSKLAVVFYGGSDHTSSLGTFFKAQGFSHKGLPKDGRVEGGKLGKPCGMKLPAYLHDFNLLFPVP